MRSAVALLRLGVPFDVAHAMSFDESLAYQIVAGQMEGGKWDWGSMAWEQPRS